MLIEYLPQKGTAAGHSVFGILFLIHNSSLEKVAEQGLGAPDRARYSGGWDGGIGKREA